MKITTGQIFLGTRMFLQACLPASVFVVLCIGILVAFNSILIRIAQNAPRFVGTAWLLLLVLYIILGVFFTYFSVRILHIFFGSQELRVQRRMAVLSGLPFYALSLLSFMAAAAGFLFPTMVNGLTAFVSQIGFWGFSLISLGYLLLLRFFLDRSTTIAHK